MFLRAHLYILLCSAVTLVPVGCAPPRGTLVSPAPVIDPDWTRYKPPSDGDFAGVEASVAGVRASAGGGFVDICICGPRSAASETAWNLAQTGLSAAPDGILSLRVLDGSAITISRVDESCSGGFFWNGCVLRSLSCVEISDRKHPTASYIVVLPVQTNPALVPNYRVRAALKEHPYIRPGSVTWRESVITIERGEPVP